MADQRTSLAPGRMTAPLVEPAPEPPDALHRLAKLTAGRSYRFTRSAARLGNLKIER
jgi:hypothetical protein